MCLERATIAGMYGASENQKFVAEPTQHNSHLFLINGISIKKIRRKEAVSRILSWAIIHLGDLSPDPSSGQLGVFRLGHAGIGKTSRFNPLLALLRIGFTALPVTRDAISGIASAELFTSFGLCCTFRKLALPSRYLVSCPMKSGLSSTASSAAAIASLPYDE